MFSPAEGTQNICNDFDSLRVFYLFFLTPPIKNSAGGSQFPRPGERSGLTFCVSLNRLAALSSGRAMFSVGLSKTERQKKQGSERVFGRGGGVVVGNIAVEMGGGGGGGAVVKRRSLLAAR